MGIRKRFRHRQKKGRAGALIVLLAASLLSVPFSCTAKAEGGDEVRRQYEEYAARFAAIERETDLEENGFDALERQRFPVDLDLFGEVMFLPAIERTYHRLALFFVDADGRIVYKTDQLETNYYSPGSVRQSTEALEAVSFQDVNRDARWDIVLITDCVKQSGTGAGRTYRVGDVLFQGEQGFYRDWRVSDKINRFGMNKSIDFIAAFVRDGRSTEFLYTESTLSGLLKHNMRVVAEQSYWYSFEKLGRLRIVPGIYRISDYDVFLVYLINERGDIVWSFQPMGEYDNLYALRGIACRDIDGDGLRDVVVLARYSSWSQGEMQLVTDYRIYYQRTGGFVEDTKMKERVACREDETMTELVKRARACWGWSAEDD